MSYIFIKKFHGFFLQRRLYNIRFFDICGFCWADEAIFLHYLYFPVQIRLGKAWIHLFLPQTEFTPLKDLASLVSFVTYWPSIGPSIKRCTCVNKRKNSGSRWTLDNNITSTQTAWVSWSQLERRCWSESQRLWALSDPRLINPSQDEEEVLLWSEELGVKITVCPRLQLISYTQPTSTLPRIKCERYIFIKKCVPSFIEVRHYCWLGFRIYLYM